MRDEGVYGAFADGDALVAALSRLQERGYSRFETYTPVPVGPALELLAPWRTRVLVAAGIAALLGVVIGYVVQWYTNAVDYPLDVGGRPSHAAPSFVPITFETAVLLGAVTAFVGLFAACGLPRPHRPLFEADALRSASVDRYWLRVRGDDPRLDWVRTTADMREVGALEVVTIGGADRREGDA